MGSKLKNVINIGLNLTDGAADDADGWISGPRNLAVYHRTSYDKILGPENALGNGVFVTFSTAYILAQLGRRIWDHVSYHNVGEANYLDKQIAAFANYQIDYNHASSKESSQPAKSQCKKAIYDELHQQPKLKKLASTLFPDQDYNINISASRITLEPGTTHRSANINQTEGDTAPLLDRPNNEGYNGFENAVKYLIEIPFIASFIQLTWQLITRYSIYYWCGWFFAWLFVGVDVAKTSLEIGLTFGIPLIPAFALFFWNTGNRVMSWFIENKPKTSRSENDDELEKKRRLLIQTRLLEIHYEKLTQQLEKQKELFPNFNTNPRAIPLPMLENNDEKLPHYARQLKGEWGKGHYLDLLHTKTAKIIFAAISGAVAGYATAYFAAWPIQYLLSSFEIAAYSLTPVAIVITLSVVIGLFFSIKQATVTSITHKQNVNAIDSKESTLKTLRKQKALNLLLRKEIDAQYIHIKTALQGRSEPYNADIFKPRISQNMIDKEVTYWQSMQRKAPSAWNKVITVLDTLFVGLFSSWTGSVVIRSLFATGALVALLAPVFATSIFTALGITVMIAYAAFKMVEFLAAKQRRIDVDYIQQATAYSHCIDAENTYLSSLYQNQHAFIKGVLPVGEPATNGLTSSGSMFAPRRTYEPEEIPNPPKDIDTPQPNLL